MTSENMRPEKLSDLEKGSNTTLNIDVSNYNLNTSNKEKSINDTFKTESENKKIIDPGKCYQCNRKVGLLGFKCHCNNIFCSKHRLSVDHSCPIDYKKLQREKLQKENPIITASKITPI